MYKIYNQSIELKLFDKLKFFMIKFKLKICIIVLFLEINQTT